VASARHRHRRAAVDRRAAARGELAIRPGVFAPEEVVPWPALRRELARRGMTVTERS